MWDIPLLDGYAFEFVPNISKDQGLLNGSLSPKFKEKWSLRSHSNDYL